MRIIGHRGAAGLALENSIEAITAARQAGVDGIEFDIRVTADGHVVLSHDKSTKRVAHITKDISKTHSKEVKAIALHNNERIPSVSEALDACGNTMAVIEGKDTGWAEPLYKAMKNRNNKPPVVVIAFAHHELHKFKRLSPETKVYVLERTNLLEAVAAARRYGFDGINLNFWILNPLTYYLAKRYKLDVLVHTVNSVLLARFIRALYPDVGITTNIPHEMQSLRG